MGPQVHTIPSPSIEMILSSNGPSNTMGVTHRPVLLEGSCSFNRWRIITSRGVDIISRAITINSSLVGTATAGIVRAKGFNYVVLDQWVGGPTVDGEVAVTARVEAAIVVDVSG